MDRQRFAVALELPTIDASARQSAADAAMPGEIGRRARLRAALEIGGRSDDCETLIGPEWHGDHVLWHQFSQPHAGVESIDNDVDQSSFSDDVDRHVGIS